MDRIKFLINILNNASKCYYSGKTPIMDDVEYDKLFDELKYLENTTGIVYSNSPTQNVGSTAIDYLEKIEHSSPMLSLDKCHSTEELKKFIGKENGILMMKMDGLTVRATYKNGNIFRLETRGDGVVGNDVTHLIGNFVNLPISIPIKTDFIVDGECIITYDDFLRINDKLPIGTEKYKNPRNLASGSLSVLDSKDIKDRPLKFIAWRVISGLEDEKFFSNTNIIITKYGFEVVPYFTYTPGTSDEIDLPDMLNSMRDKAKKIGYPIDGIVFAFDSSELAKKLGRTSHHFNHSIAYKFEDDRYETKVVDIEWTGGKTGALTPTLIFEPIEIDGTTVTRASMHNVSIMKQLHPTKGCTAYIYKANQIIPQCDSCRNDGNEEFEIPNKCPVCGCSVSIVKENNTEFLICTNDYCDGKLLKKLAFFVGKQGFDINGLSEATLEKFIELGWVKEFTDIFDLAKYYPKMINLDGFGIRSAQKLLKSIDESRHITMDKFLCSLSIPMVGKTASKLIAETYKYNWNHFILEIGMGRLTRIRNIDGIGEVITGNISSWYKSQNYITKLVNAIVLEAPEQRKKIASSAFNGKNICITGKLYKFSNRAELVQILNDLGAKEVSSVTNKTHYLLTNDKTSGSSKNKKAADIGIPVISEDEFIKLSGIEV